ncbi:MAG: SecD/SecF family protein translocase subunit, partial [Cyclobacteriaceae bacterium]|nr:SecD/SecF family protein translocase subunit [Cyclobacteriaceae bacterium]
MKNKSSVIVLTLVITVLCLYYLSFTFVSRGIQEDARLYATDQETGRVSDYMKQDYLDSIWNLPVYSLFGMEYTYKEIKDTELSFGLDLQGGMHVVLEVSPVDILKGLSGNNEDPEFLAALGKAQEMQKSSQETYLDLFIQAYTEESGGKSLANIFATAANRERISSSNTNQEVLAVLQEEVADAIDRSEIILRTRVDQFGTSQPNIQRLPGTGRIQIEIPGAENPERVRKLLQGVAKLEFWEVAEIQEINALQAINQKLSQESAEKGPELSELETDTEESDVDVLANLSGQDSSDSLATSGEDSAEVNKALKDSVQNLLDSLTRPNISPLLSLSIPMGYYSYSVSDTSTIGRILRREDIQSMLPRNIKFFWQHKATVTPNGEEIIQLNFVRSKKGGKPLLEGDVITDARADIDQYGKPAVSMRMDAIGSKKWQSITREAAAKPRGRIAIVLDDYVYSAPGVDNEIPNGNSIITGNFTTEEVRDLANILKAGSLPAPTRIVEEAIVGPTLGKVAQNQGFLSIFSGLAIVVLFMVAYYSKGGLIANLALLFNIFFILGILANKNAALTLPGIAGIVLTIGMSIDANVLIFERIREEMRR